MKPLTLDEIVPRDVYGRIRDDYRRVVIAHKRARRLAVGDNITLLFEDRETLRFQVLEMLWVEGIGESDKIQYELDTYNELMPGDGELSATLFVEITDAAEIRPELDRLIGVDEHVSLRIGGDVGGEVVRARFDPKQLEEDRISAVQYIRFGLDAEQCRRFADPAESVQIRVDHPNYDRAVEIGADVRRSLAQGLSRAPDSLLPDDPGPEAAPRDTVVRETPDARVIAPARPAARAHRIIEPVAPVRSILEADDRLLIALLEVVREVAGEIAGEHGACRVHTDVGGRADTLRWHVYAP